MIIVRYFIELRAVCSLFENCKVFGYVESCKMFVQKIVCCLIELGAVRSLFGEL